MFLQRERTCVIDIETGMGRLLRGERVRGAARARRRCAWLLKVFFKFQSLRLAGMLQRARYCRSEIYENPLLGIKYIGGGAVEHVIFFIRSVLHSHRNQIMRISR